MKTPSEQVEQWEVTFEDEYELRRTIDEYLLGVYIFGWGYPYIEVVRPIPHHSQRSLSGLLAGYRETRLRPFLERAELSGELAEIPEEAFRERLLRFRCYLAEPDEPSEELLSKLRLVIQTVRLLRRFLRNEISLVEMKRALRPLRKSLAVHAPELHTLLYDMAEQMALVGENSPEEAGKWQEEIQRRCTEWLARLHAYWYALLG